MAEHAIQAKYCGLFYFPVLCHLQVSVAGKKKIPATGRAIFTDLFLCYSPTL
jgi:hypothetical protein